MNRVSMFFVGAMIVAPTALLAHAEPAPASRAPLSITLPTGATLEAAGVGYCNDTTCTSVGYFYDWSRKGDVLTVPDLHGRDRLQINLASGADRYRCAFPATPGLSRTITLDACTVIKPPPEPSDPRLARRGDPRGSAPPVNRRPSCSGSAVLNCNAIAGTSCTGSGEEVKRCLDAFCGGYTTYGVGNFGSRCQGTPPTDEGITPLNCRQTPGDVCEWTLHPSLDRNNPPVR